MKGRKTSLSRLFPVLLAAFAMIAWTPAAVAAGPVPASDGLVAGTTDDASASADLTSRKKKDKKKKEEAKKKGAGGAGGRGCVSPGALLGAGGEPRGPAAGMRWAASPNRGAAPAGGGCHRRGAAAARAVAPPLSMRKLPWVSSRSSRTFRFPSCR